MDESALGLGKLLTSTRDDVIYAGHPDLPEIPLGTIDVGWMSIVAERNWVAIRRDRRIHTRPRGRGAVGFLAAGAKLDYSYLGGHAGPLGGHAGGVANLGVAGGDPLFTQSPEGVEEPSGEAIVGILDLRAGVYSPMTRSSSHPSVRLWSRACWPLRLATATNSVSPARWDGPSWSHSTTAPHQRKLIGHGVDHVRTRIDVDHQRATDRNGCHLTC